MVDFSVAHQLVQRDSCWTFRVLGANVKPSLLKPIADERIEMVRTASVSHTAFNCPE